MRRSKRGIVIFVAALLLLLTACSSTGQVMDGEDMVRSYTQISQEEAKEMMEQDDGHVIVDVRRPGIFPELSVFRTKVSDQSSPRNFRILTRSSLFTAGAGTAASRRPRSFLIWYSNVYEFGGINDWTGEVVAEKKLEELKAFGASLK